MNNKHDDWFTSDAKPEPSKKVSKNARVTKKTGSKTKPQKTTRSAKASQAKKATKANSEPIQARHFLKSAYQKTVNFWTNSQTWSKAAKPFMWGLTKVGHGALWFNDKKLLKKILYTILLIVIFRLAASITTPGITVNNSNFSDSSFLGIMNLMGGGTLAKFSIVALGISPYITASIIMTLLQSEVFPPIYNLAKSGPRGKRKINVITRIITLVFAILQAITMLQQFSSSTGGFITLHAQYNTILYKFFVLPMILIGGSMFTLFLGEQITNRGVGNGTSLIIFSGIAVRMPSMFTYAWTYLVGTKEHDAAFVGVMNFVIYTLSFLVLLFVILYLYKAQRQIPIQQTGSGMTTNSQQMSRLPIKLNPGGVMPIIFGLMIMSIPLQVVQFFDHQNATRIWIEANLRFTDWLGLVIMCVLVFIFSIAMGFITFNPSTIADNFKKNGTFIPGIRPGDETEEYLSSVILRLGVFSGFYLALITSIKYLQEIAGLSPTISYGGTTVIILVSVAVETLNQITARDTTHKMTKQRINALGNATPAGGLLW